MPTKNERGNVDALIERLEAVLPTVAMEIIFVDASSDGTAELVEEAAAAAQPRDGARSARSPTAAAADSAEPWCRGCGPRAAPWVCVMDADLQHPPS